MVVGSMEDSIETSKKSVRDRIIIRLTSITSYVFPFVTTFPNTAWWMGIMTMPFFYYIVFFISDPINNPLILPSFSNPTIYLLWSIVYLHRKKGDGLVITGPYLLVRHPQYLSFIILTGIMTLQSVWILQRTLGIGSFTATVTQIVWVAILTCYAFFAKLEERFLSTQYQEELETYRDTIGFFIPGVKNKNNIIEILSGIIIPFVIFFIILAVVNYSGISLIGNF